MEDVLLDTGCSRTLVRRDLVPESKRLDGSVAIRCAHGDTVEYPLATVDISVGNEKFSIEAGVADALPASVLLGTDVPNLVELLHSDSVCQDGGSEAVLAVMTRAQTKKLVEEGPPVDGRGEDPNPEGMSVGMRQVKPSSDRTDEVGEVVTIMPEVEPELNFDDDLITPGRQRVRLTRRQRRACRRKQAAVGIGGHNINVELSAEELRELQEKDDTLAVLRKAADGQSSTMAGPGFCRRDGLLYRRWTPPGCNEEEMVVEQLVLPVRCREVVVKLAHEIPLAGHLGKDKEDSATILLANTTQGCGGVLSQL